MEKIKYSYNREIDNGEECIINITTARTTTSSHQNVYHEDFRHHQHNRHRNRPFWTE